MSLNDSILGDFCYRQRALHCGGLTYCLAALYLYIFLLITIDTLLLASHLSQRLIFSMDNVFGC